MTAGPAPSPSQIRVSAEGRVVTILLRNPPVNVMTRRMMEEIADALQEIEGGGQAGLIVFRGEGRCFSAGADIREHLPEQASEMIRALRRLVEAVISTRTPTMAALHGSALGGAFEFATLADIVLVQEGTRLGLPEISLASFPPVAAAFYPSMIGWKHALQVLLTGDPIEPSRACELGLATAVLPSENFEGRVAEWIDRLTRASLPALKLCKLATMSGFVQRPFDALATTEALFIQELMKTRDAREGLEAFLQKRKPVWEHR